MSSILPTVATAFIAALLTFGLGQVTELVKRRREFAHRWDADLYDRSQEFVASTRVLESEASGRADPSVLRDANVEVRLRCNQMLVLADEGLAAATLTLQRDCYALRLEAEGGADPRPSDRTPHQRYFASLHLFYVELRRQLRIPAISASRLPD